MLKLSSSIVQWQQMLCQRQAAKGMLSAHLAGDEENLRLWAESFHLASTPWTLKGADGSSSSQAEAGQALQSPCEHRLVQAQTIVVCIQAVSAASCEP